MTNFRTRTLSAAAAAALFFGFAGAASAETNWRLTSEQPAESLEGQGVQFFADKVKELTKGQVTVTVFPSEQLGKASAAFEQLQAGTTQIHNATAAYMQRWEPSLKFISAPFMFKDRAHWARFMETDLVKGWLKTVEDKAGIMVLGNYTKFPRGSFRVMVSKKQINSLADVQGLKLRMHPDDLAQKAWSHLGAEVRVLAWSDVYEALGRGIVEAVNSPAALVRSMRFYEQAKYITRHEEYHQSVGFLTNKKAYDGLPPEQQKALLDAFNAASEYEDKLLDDNTYQELELAQKGGATYSENLDTGPFIDRMREFYDSLEQSGGLPKGYLKAVESTRM